MGKHSEDPDWQKQRMKIIGLGESSIRKSYYPELQQQFAELERKNAELKESEEKYRTLVENSFDGVLIHRDAKIVFVNRTAVRLLGGKNPGEFIGRSVFCFVHPDYMQVASERAAGALSCLQKPLHEKFLNSDGTPFDVEVVAIPINWEGSPAAQVSFRDISDTIKTGEELQRKNEELSSAYEELTATSEELQVQYDELHRSQRALEQARKKLNLLNTVTFQDIQSAAFSLSGYLELTRKFLTTEEGREFLLKEMAISRRITNTLSFAKDYQDMGIKQPVWQNVNHTIIFALSHMQFPYIRNISLDNLEIYADPLLEKVFFNLMENVIRHGTTATEVTVRYEVRSEGLVIVVEDDGAGIPAEEKEIIFTRGYGKNPGFGLFLAREVLSITGILISETGEPGRGARFEMAVPAGAYRFGAGI